MLQFRTGAVCIKGDYRPNNEDAYTIVEDLGLYLVADGMGAQNAGEKASQMAVLLLPQHLREALAEDSDRDVPKAVDDAIRRTNERIIAAGRSDPELRQMGTTIVLLVAADDRLYIGGIGDSRAYQFRNGKLHQLTVDHTLTAELVRAGTITPEEARNHRFQNVLHRYLGCSEADRGTIVEEISPQAGDRYLLCSDGVTGGVEDDRLAELLGTYEDPQEAAEHIVKAAEEGGSRDNITCLVIDLVA